MDSLNDNSLFLLTHSHSQPHSQGYHAHTHTPGTPTGSSAHAAKLSEYAFAVQYMYSAYHDPLLSTEDDQHPIVPASPHTVPVVGGRVKQETYADGVYDSHLPYPAEGAEAIHNSMPASMMMMTSETSPSSSLSSSDAMQHDDAMPYAFLTEDGASNSYVSMEEYEERERMEDEDEEGIIEGFEDSSDVNEASTTPTPTPASRASAQHYNNITASSSSSSSSTRSQSHTSASASTTRKSTRKVRKNIKYEEMDEQGDSPSLDHSQSVMSGHAYVGLEDLYATTGLPLPEAGVTAGTATAAVLSGQIHVPCNNKKVLDESWPVELLDMPIPDLNRYIKSERLSPAQVKALKEARRRKKNRLYAQRSRTKKQSQGELLEQADKTVQKLQEDLKRMHLLVSKRDGEIALLRRENESLRAQLRRN